MSRGETSLAATEPAVEELPGLPGGEPETGLSTPDAEPSPTKRPFTLAVVGDVLLDRAVGNAIQRHGPDYPWEQTGLLAEADIALANLETSVSTRGKAQDKKWTFRSKPETLDGVARAGIDIVTLANNHALDFGEQALLDTLEHLRSRGIAYIGAGANMDEARAPYITDVNGHVVAFLGFTVVTPQGWEAGKQKPGVNSGWDNKAMFAAVEQAKKQADFVVVYMHWGVEREDQPSKAQRYLGRRLVEAGADLVVGSHPHNLQGIEFYQGAPVVYSLGNFVFTDSGVPKTLETGILSVKVEDGRITEMALTPYIISAGRPVRLEGDKAKAVLNRFAGLCGKLGTEVTGDGMIKVPE
ncbi:hypothetical protein SY88_01415 [Clostridiales bacterium PH28_bin88]|nr:hypothetical protein SY88_01415 [Clostridiales bacterium PH28_bin88]